MPGRYKRLTPDELKELRDRYSMPDPIKIKRVGRPTEADRRARADEWLQLVKYLALYMDRCSLSRATVAQCMGVGVGTVRHWYDETSTPPPEALAWITKAINAEAGIV